MIPLSESGVGYRRHLSSHMVTPVAASFEGGGGHLKALRGVLREEVAQVGEVEAAVLDAELFEEHLQLHLDPGAVSG